MPRFGSSPFAFPDFRGATRRLILVNLATYFALLVVGFVSPFQAISIGFRFSFDPFSFVHGALWQPLTYSFVHSGILGTLFELLSLWFLAGFLEGFHNASWVTGLYAASVLGTAAAALALYAMSSTLAPRLLGAPIPLYGCFGGIFGLLAAIGLLYGDTQFMLFPLPIGIKARYLVMIYALIAIAMLFGQEQWYAFAQLGGALAGLRLCAHGAAPRRLLPAQRTLVRLAQPLLPLEAPPRRPQVRGLHEATGPHSELRRPGPADRRRRSQRQEALELKLQRQVSRSAVVRVS